MKSQQLMEANTQLYGPLNTSNDPQMIQEPVNNKHSTYQSRVFHNIVGVRRILLVFLRVSIYLHGLYRPLVIQKALHLTRCTGEMFSIDINKKSYRACEIYEDLRNILPLPPNKSCVETKT